ncbi:MAG: TspO/MBR family protein [Patescibacteria group bacterium]
MNWLARLGVAVLASYGAGFLGSLFITTDVGSWYDMLNKPFFQPPNWIFAPVWIVLYGLMAVAVTIIWNKDPLAAEVRGWVPLFFAHLLLNAAWTVFFFGFHAVLVALITIIILLCCIFFLICGAWEIDRRAAYLLIPYFLWVLFATVLNLAIWFLN